MRFSFQKISVCSWLRAEDLYGYENYYQVIFEQFSGELKALRNRYEYGSLLGDYRCLYDSIL